MNAEKKIVLFSGLSGLLWIVLSIFVVLTEKNRWAGIAAICTILLIAVLFLLNKLSPERNKEPSRKEGFARAESETFTIMIGAALLTELMGVACRLFGRELTKDWNGMFLSLIGIQQYLFGWRFRRYEREKKRTDSA